MKENIVHPRFETQKWGWIFCRGNSARSNKLFIRQKCIGKDGSLLARDELPLIGHPLLRY